MAMAGGVAATDSSAVADRADVADGDYRPLDDQEMEDEFDRIEREFESLEADGVEDESAADDDVGASGDRLEQAEGAPWSDDDAADMLDEEDVFPQRTASEALADAKLEQVMALRETGAFDEARRLLYEVLSEGNPDQVKVARNILEQLDT